LLRVRQLFERPIIEDIPAHVHTELEQLELGQRIRPGQTVALTAGSRGVANIPLILKSVIQYLQILGARPFIVPTMGSHGGATAEGQRHVLESYGITEEYLGVPIRASMEVVSLGTTVEGFPVYLDKHASAADHIGVIGRVKPHTRYHGPIESGLLKMMMIGLGKHVGALAAHRILLEYPYDQVVRSVGKVVLEKAPVAFGLGIVENAYDETAVIEAVRPDDMARHEEKLLVEAKRFMPRLPVREADLVIIDEIGKNISGSGMDTSIVGRKAPLHELGDLSVLPNMRLIFVRGLSEKTHGNAAGIGIADFTLSRVVREMDYRSTVINCLTAGYPGGAFLPVHFETDREVIEAALKIIGTRQPEEARVMHIRNTLELGHVYISEPCLQEPRWTNFEVDGPARPMQFSEDGRLTGFSWTGNES
jgi:hypothetical protein